MSHDPGQQRGGHPGRPSTLRPKAAHRHGRASLDRPSLFAQDAADDPADVQRVPILSALEPARRPRRGATLRANEAPMRRRGLFGVLAPNWQAKALMGLMAAGILSLLTAFVLLLLDNKAAHDAAGAQRVDGEARTAQKRPILVDSRNPLAALVAPPLPTSAPPVERQARQAPPAPGPGLQQAAVIEDLPAVPHPLATPPAVIAMAPPRAGAKNPDATPDAQPDKATVRSAGPVTPAPRRPPRPGRDEDAALVEAVLAHSASRKPPQAALPVVEELQRCAGLGGGAGATCRARICVQNPTAAACHQDP